MPFRSGELLCLEKCQVGTKNQDSPPEAYLILNIIHNLKYIVFYNREAVFYFSEGSNLTTLIL